MELIDHRVEILVGWLSGKRGVVTDYLKDTDECLVVVDGGIEWYKRRDWVKVIDDIDVEEVV